MGSVEDGVGEMVESVVKIVEVHVSNVIEILKKRKVDIIICLLRSGWDKEKYEYAVKDNNREVLDGARISESFWIDIDDNFINDVKSGKKVLLRLEGNAYYKDLEYDDTGLGYIKRFFTETARYTK